jgi:hypothetical protein
MTREGNDFAHVNPPERRSRFWVSLSRTQLDITTILKYQVSQTLDGVGDLTHSIIHAVRKRKVSPWATDVVSVQHLVATPRGWGALGRHSAYTPPI